MEYYYEYDDHDYYVSYAAYIFYLFSILPLMQVSIIQFGWRNFLNVLSKGGWGTNNWKKSGIQIWRCFRWGYTKELWKVSTYPHLFPSVLTSTWVNTWHEIYFKVCHWKCFLYDRCNLKVNCKCVQEMRQEPKDVLILHLAWQNQNGMQKDLAQCIYQNLLTIGQSHGLVSKLLLWLSLS